MKGIVILSGGLDSGVAMGFEKERNKVDIELALTFNYGQKASKKEIEHANKLCKFYGVEHKVINLDWLRELGGGLIENKIPVVSLNPERLKEVADETARAVWIPNRNMIFISIACAFAEKKGYECIITGFNREEGETFPDNRKEFVSGMNKVFKSLNGIEIKAPFIEMTKEDIIMAGRSLNFPFNLTWSCYHGYDKPCGKCESCIRREMAFKKAAKRC